MYCRRCGKENRDDARFCAGCGNSLTAEEEETAAIGGQSRETRKYAQPDRYGWTDPDTNDKGNRNDKGKRRPKGSAAFAGAAAQKISGASGNDMYAKKSKKFPIAVLIILLAVMAAVCFIFLSQRDGWKQAYIDYIEREYEANGFDDEAVYFLINVNDDEIPELYIHYETLDLEESDVLCCYYDGSVIEHWMGHDSFSYIEGKNLFMDSGIKGFDPYISYEKVCCIENDEFVVLYSGERGEIDEDDIQYNEEGNRIHDYYWNGRRVSKGEEYWKMINEVYPDSKEICPMLDAEYDDDGRYFGNGACCYDDIMAVIEEY